MSAASRGAQHSQFAPGLDLDAYIDELEEVRARAADDLCGAGEQALKTLDVFLAHLAALLGHEHERPGMYDTIQYLERLGGRAQSIAAQAERYRSTRNALAHNPDLTLRPEAALRIIEGVEKILRSAAQSAYEMARRPVAAVAASASAAQARDRMLARGFSQLAVVDDHGKLVDLLTYRDIVAAEARREIDGDQRPPSVRQVIETRAHLAVAPVGRDWDLRRVSQALLNEDVVAAVVTENGRLGETPLGIITRGTILKLR